MYTLTAACKDDIITYLATQLPYEGCGVITAPHNSARQMTRFYPIKNIHPSARHFFEYDKQQWIDINIQLSHQNEKIVCYVHSHIEADSSLSKHDLANITDLDALQMIVLYTKKNSPSIHVYRYNKTIYAFESCPLMLT